MKFEIRNSTPQPREEAKFRRWFQRLRLPRRPTSSIEQAAALNRAERLFAVNFRSPWTR